jgi:hypothetical protein
LFNQAVPSTELLGWDEAMKNEGSSRWRPLTARRSHAYAALACLAGVAILGVVAPGTAHADCVVTTNPDGSIGYDCSGSAPTTAPPPPVTAPATTRPPVATTRPIPATTRPRVRVRVGTAATSAPTTTAPTTTTATTTTAAPPTTAASAAIGGAAAVSSASSTTSTTAAKTTLSTIGQQRDTAIPVPGGPADLPVLLILVTLSLIGSATVGAFMFRSGRFG